MKSFIWIAGILAVAAASYYLLFDKGEESNLRKNTDLALNEPSTVDKVTIDNRDGIIINLTKEDTTWYINDQQKASSYMVKTLLYETLSKIRIKGPVAKKAKSNVIRTLISTAKHIKVYRQGEVIRDFYVGSATPDMSGSYVHITGAETPYIAHMLGYNSLLEPKFSTEKYDWYDRMVFDSDIDEIERITVVNNDLPEESFVLTRKKGSYSITPPLASFSQSAAKSYFALYQSRSLEGYANYLTKDTKDSIAASTPFMQITMQKIDGDSVVLRLFRKGNKLANKTMYDRRGNALVEDTERYFATYTGYDELVTIQDYVFGKLITGRSLFGEIN